jgi:hypothetical protein
MRVFLFLLFVYLAAFSRMSGQSCLPGSTLFSTQQQIDDFTIDYPGCTRISGSIVIQGGDIVNLDGFSAITSIQGGLTLSNNPILGSLSGLSLLDSVGGNLFLQHNDALTNLTGLGELDYVGGTLEVNGNENLTCFSGMGSLDYIGLSLIVENNLSLTCFAGLIHLDTIQGSLIIDNNQSMTDLSGLSSLSLVGGDFNVSNNLSLVNFDGLDQLANVEGNFVVFNNESLETMNGFNSLTSIGGDLDINRNESLSSLLGLQGLTTVSGALSVTNNESLLNLCGLENLDFAGLSQIDIFQNQVLSICHIESLCDYLALPGSTAQITNNAAGCNDISQIVGQCGSPFDCAMLPVKWLEFSGVHTVEGNQLMWTTSSEVNNDYFEIERSVDGVRFNSARKVRGAGNSSELQAYTWTDDSAEYSVTYYRLKQVDYDGGYSYSEVIKVVGELAGNPVVFSPNPASEFLILSTESRNQTVEIFNSSGELLIRLYEVPEFLDLSGYKNGLYFIRAGGDVSPFIIQKE